MIAERIRQQHRQYVIHESIETGTRSHPRDIGTTSNIDGVRKNLIFSIIRNVNYFQYS